MPKPLLNGPPSPEELQRQLQDFLRTHFQGAPVAPATTTESSGEPEAPAGESKPADFEFNHKPRDVKAHLDRFVIQQVEAKKVLSEVLPQSDRLDAILTFFELKMNSVNKAESRKAAALAKLTYSGGAVFSAAALITLLTMVLVLLAIDRNTRKD